jgi:hypothetical protein
MGRPRLQDPRAVGVGAEDRGRLFGLEPAAQEVEADDDVVALPQPELGDVGGDLDQLHRGHLLWCGSLAGIRGGHGFLLRNGVAERQGVDT